MIKIYGLSKSKVIENIIDKPIVNCKIGVWNEYKKVTREKAIQSIYDSGYGADVYIDVDNEFYVSIPNKSDMY